MWWSVPEADPQSGDGNGKVRSLALAGTLGRRQRTVLTLVPLSSVVPNPDQPRKHFAEEALADLAASIKKMVPELEQKHRGKKIDFEIVVKDGRVGLKPVPKG